MNIFRQELLNALLKQANGFEEEELIDAVLQALTISAAKRDLYAFRIDREIDTLLHLGMVQRADGRVVVTDKAKRIVAIPSEKDELLSAPLVPLKGAVYYPNTNEGFQSSLNAQQSSLDILIDPGSAPPHEIGNLLSELSHLYRMLGGSGITFDIVEIRKGALA